jgi:hypothetical protein
MAHAAMNAHHACANGGAVQGGDIAETNNPLGMAGKFAQGDTCEQLHGSVATTRTEYGTDGGVAQRPEQVGSPLVGSARKTMVGSEGMGSHHGAIAPLREDAAPAADGSRVDGRARRENGHTVARFQEAGRRERLRSHTGSHQGQKKRKNAFRHDSIRCSVRMNNVCAKIASVLHIHAKTGRKMTNRIRMFQTKRHLKHFWNEKSEKLPNFAEEMNKEYQTRAPLWPPTQS